MQEVLDPLVVTYVASHPNSGVVLARLWPLNRDALLRAMVALWQKDASNVARVLDVCQARRRALPPAAGCGRRAAPACGASPCAGWVAGVAGAVACARGCQGAGSRPPAAHKPCLHALHAQELKGLTVVLDATPAPFCLELAALAARREYLNLEK